MDTILKAIAAVFLALFAGIWLWVAWKLWRFNPTTEVPTLTFSEAIAGTGASRCTGRPPRVSALAGTSCIRCAPCCPGFTP